MKREPKQRTCTDCTRKKKQCPSDHFDEDEGDSPNAMAGTSAADVQRVRQCQIDGLGDGIRKKGSGERYSKVHPTTCFAIKVALIGSRSPCRKRRGWIPASSLLHCRKCLRKKRARSGDGLAKRLGDQDGSGGGFGGLAECSNCTCRMAAPGETLMEVYSMNQCPQVQVPLRKHRKSFFINPSSPGLSLVQSQVERCAGAMQSISAIAGTQQERRPHSHRLLQHGPLEQAQETRKTSSLQQQRWRSCALFLIATSDTSANTITVEEGMGGLSGGRDGGG